MSERLPPFAVFLRHRYRAHVHGWLVLGVAGLAGYYISLSPHEPLWLLVPVSFIVAFFVVSVWVATAALLRVPWWLLAPLTFLSMVAEWGWRRWRGRPWRRRPQPREPWLSHPFALWQRRRLRRLRRERVRARGRAQVIAFPAARACRSPRRAAHQPSVRPPWSPQGLGGYIGEVFERHWMFWFFTAPAWITLWFWVAEDQMFLVALILGVLLWLLGSVILIIPIAAGLLALASSFLAGAGLTPLQRQAVVQHAAAERARQRQTAVAVAAPTTSPPQRGSWVWPLLLGLWIGSAWGADD
ncbi:hypothetical protein Talka_00939 [Tepidimonas alkaliphilus]|uniref:Uncharacterized protein n=1 Tax=Tepidimonas alkaliphilus TaxID=2588942 RepID=A0A554WAJ2_9BURK|nr:hypothetical protein [Tepidimonas alkaliphilus]TSE20589.1 hypothetical protein Talka_00939 [Tepidimonas alkaliphilus]